MRPRARHALIEPLGDAATAASCNLHNYPELVPGPKKGDDDKRLCTNVLNGLSPQDVILSLGSNNEFGFEEQMLGCTRSHIAVFDCTVANATNKPLTQRVSFHRYCVGDEAAESAQFRTYATIAQIALEAAAEASPATARRYGGSGGNGLGRIALLKADIEGWEWLVLDQVLAAGPAALPIQIAVELHLKTQPWRNVPGFRVPSPVWHWPMGRSGSAVLEDGANRLRLLRTQMADAGYLLVDRNDNPWCGHCTEVLFLRNTQAARRTHLISTRPTVHRPYTE